MAKSSVAVSSGHFTHIMSKLTIRRILIFLLGLGIIFFGLWSMGFISSLKEEPPKKPEVKRIPAVETETIRNGSINSTLEVQGQLQAYNKIALFAEVGGTVEATGRPFKVGTYFPEGSVLLNIDDTEARLNLQSQRASLMNAIAGSMPDLRIDYPETAASWESYLAAYDIEAELKELPEVTDQSARLFLAGRNIYSQYYSIKSLEDRLSKYTLYAPFGGVLTSTSIDQGAVVRAGQQIGELMATGYYELAATVPLSELEFLQNGGSVELYSEDLTGRWTGEVKRVSDQIDPASQTVTVFIGVRGRNLREGMYLRGEAEATTFDQVAEIDRDLLNDSNEVFVVEYDSLLRRLPAEVQKINRETVIVSGLPDGTQLLTSDVAGAFDGMRVKTAKADTLTRK
ncbi:MAG: efflux RND transporter periplasmic adaptor subunit [Bacteroidota bacterium]